MSRSFFDFFPPPKILMPPVFGLSIDDDAIRVVEYKQKHGKLSLKNSTEYPLPKGVVWGGVVANQEKLVEILKKIGHEQDTGSCALSLSEEKSFVYATTISFAPSEEISSKSASKKYLTQKMALRKAVEATLAQNIPLSAEQTVFDFVVTTLDEKNGNANVVVFAFPLDIANSFLDSLSRAGLTPISFETESQAVARSVVPRGVAGTYLLIHFVGYKVIIAIVSEGIIHFASTVLHTAESNAKTVEEAQEGASVKQGFEEPVELVAVKNELLKVVSYWHSERQVKTREKNKIQSVIISGDVSHMLDLPDYISKNIRLPSKLANVWQNAFSLNESIPEISFEHSLVFASAAGSALLPFSDDV